jgi:small-conductance mechanosensitive channel
MKYIVVFLVALLVLVAMLLLRLGMKRLVNLYPRLNLRTNFLVSIEFIVWLVYIFWAVNHLFSEKFYFHYLVFAIIFIVFGFLSWFLFSDIIAGIVFKTKHNFKKGSHISAGEYSGQITSQRLTYLKLKTEDGQVMRVPYSRINHAVISEMTHTEALKEHSINLEISNETSKTKAETLIRDAILNSPWSNLNEEPSIKFLAENKKSYVFELMLFSTNLKHMKFIESALEKIPSAKVISKL